MTADKRIDPIAEVKLKEVAVKDQSAAIDPRISARLKVHVKKDEQRHDLNQFEKARKELIIR